MTNETNVTHDININNNNINNNTTIGATAVHAPGGDWRLANATVWSALAHYWQVLRQPAVYTVRYGPLGRGDPRYA